MLTIMDGTQPITLWHHQDDTTTGISEALIRRFRHRRYTQVVDTAVPVNYSHWYFAVPNTCPHPNPCQSGSDLPEGEGTMFVSLPEREGTVAYPLPGDEITDPNGAVWTILEVNHSPLTGIWQTVCETFAFAEPTEHVDHLRQSSIVSALIPVRVGAITETMEPEFTKRLTFYVSPSNENGAIAVEPDDVFQRLDGSQWKIVRVERPKYRARWTAVVTIMKSG